MANASVEKLKALGIRHGEKAAVGLAATLFVVLAARAIVYPTLDMKPDQLKTQADTADANLRKPQDPNDILAKLEQDGVTDPGFVKLVDNQVANALKPGDYRVRLDWVTPEPGAGLIRDQPELVAPTELAAFPGRGGVLMYALDTKGDRVLDTGDAAKTAKRGRRGAGNRGPMGPGSMPGGPGGGGGAAERPEDAQRRRAAEAERLKRSLVGVVDKAKEKEDQAKAADPAADPAAAGPWKEETRGKRWITVTAVIDNEQMNKNWLAALKNPAIAYPNYKRVDLERQLRQSEGAWTDWAAIDKDKNYAVLDNIPEADQEYVPEPKRPASLVDPLPFLRAGYWTSVHVARLVPADVREAPKADMANGGPMGMGMMGGRGPGGGGPGGMELMMGGGPGRGGSMPMGGEGAMGMAMGMGMGSDGGPVDEPVVPNNEPTLMIRSLDFTVDPDTTYRFRARVVVVNPNKDHTDVNPGVDTESQELVGPWSEPTDAVTVPADVVSYAQAAEPNLRRSDLVLFQVVRWDPATGQTVYKTDDAGPGWIVGDYDKVQMPSSDGTGTKLSMIDFNSRAVVLDTFGGGAKIPDIGIQRNTFAIPATAMVVEPDGSVVIRSQARDRGDEVRQDMEDNYKQAIADSGKKREPGAGGRSFNAGMGQGQGRKKKGRRG